MMHINNLAVVFIYSLPYKARFGVYNQDQLEKMKRETEMEEAGERLATCPDCSRSIKITQIKTHINECNKYIPTYINNVNRCMGQLTNSYLEFLNAEMDIIKESLKQSIEERRQKQGEAKAPNSVSKSNSKDKDVKKDQWIKNYIHNKKKSSQAELPPNKPKDTSIPINNNSSQKSAEKNSSQIAQISKQPKRKQDWQQIDPDIFLNDRMGQSKDEKISCISPNCKNPVSNNEIEKFTYLDQCLHTICLFCFRDYIRNNYVKLKGEIKCPGASCDCLIPYIQIKQLIDANVLLKLENQLNSKSLGLIECQKCHESYQFEKGKPSDAPKKTAEGKTITPPMAKHYAENRFQCPKCRTQQCQTCKAVPYHIGFNCKEFQEHKLKKKCRYCHSVLPKGYMSETGIKTFDDICDSEECSHQTRQACSKMHACGHPCCGYIREKVCLPCLNQKCALLKSDQLHGQNENSYCSLCYVQVLSEAPCVLSKCGHIFHFKCLKKRLELKWETARIIFRFCECPLCNKWMELPEESPLNRTLQTYKILYTKIKEKALKRLTYEEANNDAVLKDSTSPYFKNQEKYATTIYAYFQCYQCHEPYFGGRKSCADAMNDPKSGEKFNPKELICPSCCPVQGTDCKKHGKEYISFKCRFCCSVAQWFCWGSTHFCDSCHKRQIDGEYISRITKDKLPKCEGKEKCPVGGEHGGNGDEFCLGCGICRGERLDFKDF